jgi:hypothetical protein
MEQGVCIWLRTYVWDKDKRLKVFTSTALGNAQGNESPSRFIQAEGLTSPLSATKKNRAGIKDATLSSKSLALFIKTLPVKQESDYSIFIISIDAHTQYRFRSNRKEHHMPPRFTELAP